MTTPTPEYRIRYATPERAARAAAAFRSDLSGAVRVRIDGRDLYVSAPPAATALLTAAQRLWRVCRRPFGRR